MEDIIQRDTSRRISIIFSSGFQNIVLEGVTVLDMVVSGDPCTLFRWHYFAIAYLGLV